MKIYFEILLSRFSISTIYKQYHKPLSQAQSDFSFFSRNSAFKDSDVNFQITLKRPLAKRHKNKPGFYLFSTEMCHVYQNGSRRICVYDENHVVWIKKMRSGKISISLFAAQDALTEEILNLLILSFSGEMLDRAGFHRLHAAGIFENNMAYIFPRDSGFGKSTFIMQKLNEEKALIYGDETVLTNGKSVFPFIAPVSIKTDLHQKALNHPCFYRHMHKKLWGDRFLLKIPLNRVAQNSSRFQLNLETKMDALRFLFSFTFGLGVVQMREFMIRPDNFFQLITIFFKRLVTGIRLLPFIHVRKLRKTPLPSTFAITKHTI